MRPLPLFLKGDCLVMTVIMTLLAVCAMVAVDQAVKYWAVTMLAPIGSIPLIPGVLQLTYRENSGAAFSFLANQNQSWLFVLFSIVVLCGIIYALRTNRIQRALGKFSLIIISAGAIGNAIDRVIHNYVIDMIDACFINFPVFNIADIYVTVGVALFAIYYLFLHKDTDITEEK